MKLTKEELKKRLTPEQFRVTQEDGTEAPFQNAYWDNEEEGIYVDLLTGEPLFSTTSQYDAGCGWPSFTKPIQEEILEFKKDTSFGMLRTEVRTKETDYHLGHVFPDGPKESGGLRYCINSAALRFIPKQDLIKEGYEEFLKLFQD